MTHEDVTVNPHLSRPRQYGNGELLATSIAGVLLAIACWIGYMWSFLAGMASDACMGAEERCSEIGFGLAYILYWGGIGLAVLVPLVGIIKASSAGKPILRWPLFGFAILATALVTGTVVLAAAVGGL